MLSLYIHIPFCKSKCWYCDFFVFPVDKASQWSEYFDKYTKGIIQQIDYYWKIFPNEKISTIYFGGGTPLVLGKQNLFNIIDKISDTFDLTQCEEINFELNPDPFEDVLDFIACVNKKYKNFFRIRYSFGIQSLDDQILDKTNRGYVYNTLIWFIRDLVNYKKANNVFNFDFICFGKFADYQKLLLLPDYKLNFLKDFINSWFADSFSVYTIELFPGSFMYKNFDVDQEKVTKEFQVYKKILYNAGYKRYEISNFELPGKRSLHNIKYWKLRQYLGLGLGASSFLYKDYANKVFEQLSKGSQAVRYENTISWKDFLNGKVDHQKEVFDLTYQDLLTEQFFLWLRTDLWITAFQDYEEVLVENYQSIVEKLIDKGYILNTSWKILLSDKWMDIYNDIITELIWQNIL